MKDDGTVNRKQHFAHSRTEAAVCGILLALLLTGSLLLRMQKLSPENIQIFDEVYYTPSPLNSSITLLHPPLGVYINLAGYTLFGPFGWRITSAIFGTGSLFLFYLLARKFFSPSFSLMATYILSSDFLHLSLSKLGMLDVYAFFFSSLLSLFLFTAKMKKKLISSFCSWEYPGDSLLHVNGQAFPLLWHALFYIFFS